MFLKPRCLPPYRKIRILSFKFWAFILNTWSLGEAGLFWNDNCSLDIDIQDLVMKGHCPRVRNFGLLFSLFEISFSSLTSFKSLPNVNVEACCIQNCIPSCSVPDLLFSLALTTIQHTIYFTYFSCILSVFLYISPLLLVQQITTNPVVQQWKFIILELYRSKVWHRFYWPKIKMLAGLLSFLEALPENLCLFFCQILDVTHTPWLMDPFLHPQGQQHCIFLTLLVSSCLSLSQSEKFLFLRTHVIGLGPSG